MFPEIDPFPEVEILEIHDDYTFMDKRLVNELKEAVEGALERYAESRDPSAD